MPPLGHADKDELLPPDQIASLDQAMAKAGVHLTTELYKGAAHGFTAKDAPSYDATMLFPLDSLRPLLRSLCHAPPNSLANYSGSSVLKSTPTGRLLGFFP